MARPAKELPVASALAAAGLRVARDEGLDASSLAMRFGLVEDDTGIASAAPHVPEELLQALDRLLPGKGASLRAGALARSAGLDLARLAVHASATVADALAQLARGLPLLQGDLTADAKRDTAGTRWTLHSPRSARGPGRRVEEAALAYALSTLREAMPHLVPARVSFTQARVTHLAAIEDFFGTSALAFGLEDASLVFEAKAAATAMPRADARALAAITPVVEAELARHRQGTSFRARVVALLSDHGLAGLELSTVASTLHMSARTLQRRLEDEGVQFNELVDAARVDAAKRLLADPTVSLTAIAIDLGFADLATFSRAFKRWTGMPPGQWRRS